MATFFLKFTVSPVPGSQQAEIVAGAFVLCWVVADSTSEAFNKAQFYVTKGDWEIMEPSELAVEVTEGSCRDWDIGHEHFRKAQPQGIALLYTGWSRDGKTTAGPFTLNGTRRFDLNDYITAQKKLAGKGKCLHFESGGRCQEIISAHSIQKGGQLTVIARDGHVYAGSADMGDLKRNDGRIVMKRRGIHKMSTFAGFCARHDNEVFAPIDKPLLPTDEQTALYAYRSLCREFFVKENALALVASEVAKWPKDHPFTLFKDLMTGIRSSLQGLNRHKAAFEESLKRKSFVDFEYVLAESRQKPVVAFSGLLYPHFDFCGRQLQALEDLSTPLDLITFCSAPLSEGWGFLFAWHRSSARICREFVGSLMEAVCDGARLADALLRLLISTCENLALAPAWWEGLDESQRVAIHDRINFCAGTFTPIDSDYLSMGLENIAGWEFENAISNVHASA